MIRRKLAAAAGALTVALGGTQVSPVATVSAATATAGGGSGWVVAWTSAMAWQAPGPATDATVRQTVPLSAGGSEVRVQLSNAFGAAPLTVGATTVGVGGAGADVVPGTIQTLAWKGQPTVTIPAGGTATSDPVTMQTHAGETLDVTVWVPGSAAVTAHYDAGPVSYGVLGAGDLATQASGTGFGLASSWDRWVSAVEVRAAPASDGSGDPATAGGPGAPGATVVLGDSISDGFNSRCGLSDLCELTTPWPAVLERRLQQLPGPDRVSVVDESITANTLTTIDTPLAVSYRRGGGGPPGLERLSDLLALPGVDRLVMLLGTNDLWFGATAAQVIAGYEKVLAVAQAAHVGVIGVTLLPREGSEGWTPTMERYREQVNHWILTSGRFPAVLNLAAVAADVYGGACDTARLYPPYDSGDHLHPNTAGETAMADAVPTELLGAGPAPLAPPVVAATPTPGCSHPQVLTVNRPFPAVAPPGTAPPPTTAPPPSTPTTTSPTTTRAAGTTGASGAPVGTTATSNPGGGLWVAAAGGTLLIVAAGGLIRRRDRRPPRHRRHGGG